MLQWFELVLGTRSNLFMADAIDARPWMRCQGNVAHGTLVQVSYITRNWSPCDNPLLNRPIKKSTNILASATWSPTAKFNFRQYFQLYGISISSGPSFARYSAIYSLFS